MNSFDFAPYIRFSYYESGIVRLFLDGTASIGFDKVKDGDMILIQREGLSKSINRSIHDIR